MGILRKIIVFLLLLCAGFSLYAQSNADIFIFLSAISGASSSPGDNSIINSMLANEITLRDITLLNSPQGANYLLYGSLGPYDDDYGVNEDPYASRNRPNITYTFNAPMAETPHEPLYVFQLTLRIVETDETIMQSVIYTSFEELYIFFPVVMNNLFSYLPLKDTSPSYVEWLNKWLYVGGHTFWSPRVYYGTEQSAHFVNFGGGILGEVHFWKFLSFETGIQMVPDWVVYSTGVNYQNLMLELPFALRFVLKLNQNYMLGPHGGVLINVPLYDTTKTPLFSWMIGIIGGVRAGPGIFYIEPRYAMDIGRSSIKVANLTKPFEYQRFIVQIGIGYKFGFFTK